MENFNMKIFPVIYLYFHFEMFRMFPVKYLQEMKAKANSDSLFIQNSVNT